ncbi:MAG: hypothetical protein IJ332_03005, partial [Clostridia bacterium]|nr:hypothetical protein [Clostridia bacterium]
AEPVADTGVKCKYEKIVFPRKYISQEKIDNARHIIATVKEIPGIKIAADGTSKDQYDLAMSKKLIEFIETTPEEFEIPLHFMQIGDVKFYVFPTEIFCYFGLYVKENCGAEKRMVASNCNGNFGYIPTKDMFYDTIYESLPGASKLDPDAGYIMADKLLEMGK